MTMRIGLVSLDYPPEAAEGVARQRHVLAHALAALGHDVHVITKGPRRESAPADGVTVHRYATDVVHAFHPTLPVLDRPLTDAQLLCEGVLDVHARHGLDVVDVPLWLAQPLALVRHAPCPVVVWLQTTLLQLVELQGRAPRRHEEVLAECDRQALRGAAACIADSTSIVDEIVRLYDLPALPAKATLVYPGIADAPVPARAPRAHLEALVVGRLEHRKSTALFFEALPRLLAEVPELHVRFIGRDNSGADGFRKSTGQTYPEAWATAHPGLGHRVAFDGYVDDATLARRYEEADLLVHPARYESFGLIFLEAMRAGVPVVACRAGGAREVFAAGEADGAVLVPPGDMTALADAVIALARDRVRRDLLGAAARRRFDAAFSSTQMARDTAAVYARVVNAPVPRRSQPPRVFHVMEALQERDAVSGITRTAAGLLADEGVARPVMALFAAEAVRGETGRLRGLRPRQGDAAIVHYWGYSRLEQRLLSWPGPLAVHYHNITPPAFFTPGSAHDEMTRRGYAQLARLADRFDLVLGDSEHNVRELARLRTRPGPGLCVYPVVERAALLAAPFDAGAVHDVVGDTAEPLWLFVGRLAPNKRQDDVMRAFDRFVAATGRGRLALVGDASAVPGYVSALRGLAAQLPAGKRIAIVGSVPDAVLRAWYRRAAVFVCASQHEGFCVPIAEAMAFAVPVVALDRGAVGETVGEGGLVLDHWHDVDVAARIADLLDAPARRAAQTAAAARRLEAFSREAARLRLRDAVRFLREGTPGPHFLSLTPPHVAAPETDTVWAPSTT